jgi:hypothetical protein
VGDAADKAIRPEGLTSLTPQYRYIGCLQSGQGAMGGMAAGAELSATFVDGPFDYPLLFIPQGGLPHLIVGNHEADLWGKD